MAPLTTSATSATSRRDELLLLSPLPVRRERVRVRVLLRTPDRASSKQNPHNSLSRRTGRGGKKDRAFTLVELLTVIGIIVLLMALGLPALFKAWRSSQRAKGAADFQIIGSALEAFKQDFGDYPRVD